MKRNFLNLTSQTIVIDILVRMVHNKPSDFLPPALHILGAPRSQPDISHEEYVWPFQNVHSLSENRRGGFCLSTAHFNRCSYLSADIFVDSSTIELLDV